MKCCVECFKDKEVRAAIEMIGHKGECPICKRKNVWIYDSNTDADVSNVEELLDSILEIYVPESELPDTYPKNEVKSIVESFHDDWKIFAGKEEEIKTIVNELVDNSFTISDRILVESVGIPQLYDETYLSSNCIMGCYSWETFKKCLRNENRFHNKYINLKMLENILQETEIIVPKGEKFFRARVANEKGRKGFLRRDMWGPPDDIATPGRANSKGQSCLYLSNEKMTTIKEIRAHAFDYVTIATFRLNKDIRVLDLSSITHDSPFYSSTDKIAYLINEKILRKIENDLAKPMSRWDSDLDYLPTQYISDFAKSLGYDGVKYYSTFNKEAYNLALFDSSVCDCTYHRNFLIGNLDYQMNNVICK